MSVKENRKIDLMIEELENALKFENEDERIDVKASLIQLDILDDVKKLMEEKKLSRTELAKKLNKSKSFVSQLFSGDKALNLKMISQFQEIFGVKFIPSFKEYSSILGKMTKESFSNPDYALQIFNIADYYEDEKEAA
ncbi:MAG: helix-turn-helix transcriptional regulator [Melioribacteraceae bacterium]